MNDNDLRPYRTESRRLRNYPISQRDLVEAFCGMGHREFYGLPVDAKIPALPEGAVIECIFHAPDCRCFFAQVSHDSFEEVPDGQMIPIMEPAWTVDYDVLHRTEINGQECYRFRQEVSPEQDWRDRASARCDIELRNCIRRAGTRSSSNFRRNVQTQDPVTKRSSRS